MTIDIKSEPVNTPKGETENTGESLKPWWHKMSISRKELFSLANDVDAGIQKAVVILNAFNITTQQSCEGRWDVDGENTPNYLGEHHHCYLEPTVDFSGTTHDGFTALMIMGEHGIDVSSLRREWRMIHGEPTGPIWSMTFTRRLKKMSDEEISDFLNWYER